MGFPWFSYSISRLFKSNLSNTTVWLAVTILTSLVAGPVTVASFDVGPWVYGIRKMGYFFVLHRFTADKMNMRSGLQTDPS